MIERLTIAGLRKELGLSLEAFGQLLGGFSKGHTSGIERGIEPCTVAVALAIEKLSGGRLDAADLNDEVRAARMTLPVREIAAAGEAMAERTVLCATCERRTDDPATRDCTFSDCPHVGRVSPIVSPAAAGVDAQPGKIAA